MDRPKFVPQQLMNLGRHANEQILQNKGIVERTAWHIHETADQGDPISNWKDAECLLEITGFHTLLSLFRNKQKITTQSLTQAVLLQINAWFQPPPPTRP